jgi:ribonuclease E
MLVDATHPEETRVAVVDGTRLEEFDFEIASRRQIKSNIYLAKVTRVEPSLQAAFVEYGGNRHGFLPFPEIHPDYYRIPVGDRPMSADGPEEPWADTPYVPLDESAVQPQDDAPAHEPAAEVEQAASADPVVYEEAPATDNEGESEPESLTAESDGPVTSQDAAQEAAAAEEAAAVDTVGGDEVEDAQRSRRQQMPHYKIQEVIKRRQIMLVQVSKEERGNKGAAVTTFLSLPGRYCVLMPNTARGGGVSRKIANPSDRKRMKELISDLEVPDGMSVILRTAGVERSKAEIKRDLEYLLRLWENIRTLTLESTAPALIYEEGNLVKRAIRDLYSKDIEAIEIAGEEGYRQAKDFMRMLMPSHAKKVQPYRDPAVPLFHRYQVESQIDLMHNPVAHLRSGGYIVINQTEALVSIDVNSGRSTRERNIEETAVKTNLEAADEIARQLRLRDMGGLIVIDFIDMDEPRHDGQVERRLKEAMKNDRARIQVGRISPFGLLELSRQRMHPSLVETNFHTCQHCLGTGLVRSIESSALLVLRAIEDEGIKRRSAELSVTVAGNIALYILNQKRAMLIDIEQRYGFSVRVLADDGLIAPEHRIERLKMKPPGSELPPSLNLTNIMAADDPEDADIPDEDDDAEDGKTSSAHSAGNSGGSPAGELGADGERKRKRRRSRRRRGGRGDEEQGEVSAQSDVSGQDSVSEPQTESIDDADSSQLAPEEGGKTEDAAATGEFETAPEGETVAEGIARRRRRGRRGGRSRPRRGEGAIAALPLPDGDDLPEGDALPEQTLPEGESQGAAETPPAAETQAETVVSPPVEEIQVATIQAEEIVPEPVVNGLAVPIEAEAQDDAEPAPATGRPYENVNLPPEEPRRGWWKRLTE